MADYYDPFADPDEELNAMKRARQLETGMQEPDAPGADPGGLDFAQKMIDEDLRAEGYVPDPEPPTLDDLAGEDTPDEYDGVTYPGWPNEDPEGAIEEERRREQQGQFYRRADAGNLVADGVMFGTALHQSLEQAVTFENMPAEKITGATIHGVDPDYVTQETDGPSTQPYRPMVAEEGGARPADPSDERDLASWGATIAYLVDTDRVAKRALSGFDQAALAGHRARVGEQQPAKDADVLWAWARSIYTASLVEPYGDAVPTWNELSGDARTTYRRQAARVQELLRQELTDYEIGTGRRHPPGV